MKFFNDGHRVGLVDDGGRVIRFDAPENARNEAFLGVADFLNASQKSRLANACPEGIISFRGEVEF